MKQRLHAMTLPFAVANLILMTLHQMDAVFWREWEMLGLGLDYEAFLFITILFCAPGIYYIGQLAKGKRSGYIYALIWSLFGFVVPIFHSYFFLIGDVRFRASLSILLIFGAGIISLPLFVIAMDGLKKGAEQKGT